MSGKTPIYDVPEALKRKILPGFTCIEHGIYAMSRSGFGWFGKLQVELDGEMRVISAGGTASLSDGNAEKMNEK